MAQGVRFFFQDPQRGVMLLDELEVPEAERAGLLALAEQVLQAEETPARIIIDTTPWAHKTDELFAELKRLLIMEGPYPIALVILEDQYDRLPRSFDPLLANKEKLRLERVKTSEQGWERAQSLAEEQGWVLSTRRFAEFERWLAADFDGSTLKIEPANGLELYRSQGQLPGLESVLHDLASLLRGVAPDCQPRRVHLPSGGRLHRLMRALRSEEESDLLREPMGVRQDMAQALGITATSTARERTAVGVEALRKVFPVKIDRASEEQLETHRIQARRRNVGPLALWVDALVHLINVPDAERWAEKHPWLRVHDIQPDPTPLSQLLAAVESWNELDFLADPFLDHVLVRLDPEQKQRTAFLHARAGLLLTEALAPRSAPPVADWLPVVKEFLAGAPPAAQLRLRAQGTPIAFAGRQRAPFVVTRARVKQVNGSELEEIPPVGDVLLRRDEHPCMVIRKGWNEPKQWRRPTPAILLPVTPDRARDSAFWLDIFDASEFEADDWQAEEHALWRDHKKQLIPGHLQEWEVSEFQVAHEAWEEADRELALAWLALTTALSSPQAITLHDGTVLLKLGGAFFAELRVRQRADPSEERDVHASLLVNVTYNANAFSSPPILVSDLSDLVTTHTVKGGYDFGARLPRQIFLQNGRFCVDIRFRGSALFAGAADSAPHAAASVVRSEQEKRQREEAAERQRRDDDND
ncbi:hypothetical protein D7Y23_18830 [Corallococcus sp. AB050B]|nr:hypothetical protein D7Y23_18830 [Corallococcus sp. AB050B]